MRRSVARIIGTLARRQHGIVSRRQLLDAGISDRMIRHRLRRETLVRMHQGVYRTSPLLHHRSTFMAAVLAGGPETYLSHRSAAELWEILPASPEDTPVDIMVAARDAARRRCGLRVHRSRTLREEDRAQLEGIPVTSACRTVRDLAAASTRSGSVTRREVERALAAADRGGLIDMEALRRIIVPREGRAAPPGSRLIRALLDSSTPPAFTRSEAEEVFLGILRDAGFPTPRTNVKVGAFEIDALWPGLKLAVEVDGFRYHSSRRQFEADRRRDAELAARGIQVLRVTWRQLVNEREKVIAGVGQALGNAAARR